MTTSHVQLRQMFKEFWKMQGHKEIPPIPLVPQNDPTTLFTGSGMQQLVPYLLGEPHPLGKKLFNIQPCFRSQDIEEVGDNRHTTFFEMMGNWSLGTYFKKEQLSWFWEFLTKELGLPKEKLYVSVFGGTKEIPEDKETYKIWKSLGIPEERIFKYGADKNWWSRAGEPKDMPAGEPGGPDSEVFYEFTQVKHDPLFGKKCHPNCECGRFLEIGNSVFMEYRKNPDGSFSSLPNKNVDFGGGIERILAALNDAPDIFTTDVYKSIMNTIKNNDIKLKRIIADHIKAAVFLIKNGILPSPKEQGYVLRRLLRRSIVKAGKNKEIISKDFFAPTIKQVLSIYDGIYFNIEEDFEFINNTINEETLKFSKTLERGLKEIEKINKLDGKTAFNLYQSYGFPFEITEELAHEKKQVIDKKDFLDEFLKHKQQSKLSAPSKFKGGLADQNEETIKYHTSTHLIHQALTDILGPKIRQEGSNITTERLRFDYFSPVKPSSEQIKKVEKLVNEKIFQKLPVEFKIMPKEQASKLGAKSFFKQKYPEAVKVYFIGDYSKEFCGGPHVKNTSEIGKIEIFKNEKIGSNIYRIYAK